MTTGTLFNQLKAGKITKEQFLYEVRRDVNLPFISPLTTFKEAIQILQNRGIITEVFEMGSLEERCSCGGSYDTHEDAGEMVCAACGERQPISEDNDTLTKGAYRADKLGSDVLGEDPEDKEEYDPFYDREEEINYGVDDEDKEVGDDMEGNREEDFLETEAPSLREQVQDFVKKAMEGGSSMDEAKKQAREYFSKEPAALNEAVKPKLTIDTVNPYEFKKGVNIEMGVDKSAAPDWSSYLGNLAGDIQKAQAKVLKNLAKDPAYYTNQIAGKKKEKVVKLGGDGMTKGKLAVEDKANVKVKKEGPVKTKGVKVMPDKGVTGTEKVMKEALVSDVPNYWDSKFVWSDGQCFRIDNQTKERSKVHHTYCNSLKRESVPTSTSTTSVQDMNMGNDGKPAIPGLKEKTAKIKEYVKAQLKKEIVQVKDDKGDTVKLAADKNTADKFVKSQDLQVQRKLKVTGQ
jgi:hypothetical protein